MSAWGLEFRLQCLCSGVLALGFGSLGLNLKP